MSSPERDAEWPSSGSGSSFGGEGHIEDKLLDQLFEDDLDWVDIVRSYPIPSLVVSAVGGYLLGRLHGTSLFNALGDHIAERVNRALEP